jgi:hypothetical protein
VHALFTEYFIKAFAAYVDNDLEDYSLEEVVFLKHNEGGVGAADRIMYQKGWTDADML